MVPHRSTPRRIMARRVLVVTRAIAQPTELPLDQPHAAAVATVLHAALLTALALMRVLPLAHQGVTALVRSRIAPINAIALEMELSLEIQIAAASAIGNTAAPTLSLSPLKALRRAKTVHALPVALRLDQRDAAAPALQQHSRAVAIGTNVTR